MYFSPSQTWLVILMSFSTVSFTHSTLPSGKLKHLLIVLVLKCGRVEKSKLFTLFLDLDAIKIEIFIEFMILNQLKTIVNKTEKTFSLIGCKMIDKIII